MKRGNPYRIRVWDPVTLTWRQPPGSFTDLSAAVSAAWVAVTEARPRVQVIHLEWPRTGKSPVMSVVFQTGPDEGPSQEKTMTTKTKTTAKNKKTVEQPATALSRRQLAQQAAVAEAATARPGSSYEQLAETTGLGETVVRRAAEALEASGVLVLDAAALDGVARWSPVGVDGSPAKKARRRAAKANETAEGEPLTGVDGDTAAEVIAQATDDRPRDHLDRPTRTKDTTTVKANRWGTLFVDFRVDFRFGWSKDDIIDVSMDETGAMILRKRS